MPIWLRKFTFNKLKEFYDKEKEEAEKQQSQLKNRSNPKDIARPNIAPKSSMNPTYSYKAPKK
jgi:hypothetical protein